MFLVNETIKCSVDMAQVLNFETKVCKVISPSTPTVATDIILLLTRANTKRNFCTSVVRVDDRNWAQLCVSSSWQRATHRLWWTGRVDSQDLSEVRAGRCQWLCYQVYSAVRDYSSETWTHVSGSNWIRKDTGRSLILRLPYLVSTKSSLEATALPRSRAQC